MEDWIVSQYWLLSSPTLHENSIFQSAWDSLISIGCAFQCCFFFVYQDSHRVAKFAPHSVECPFHRFWFPLRCSTTSWSFTNKQKTSQRPSQFVLRLISLTRSAIEAGSDTERLPSLISRLFFSFLFFSFLLDRQENGDSIAPQVQLGIGPISTFRAGSLPNVNSPSRNSPSIDLQVSAGVSAESVRSAVEAGKKQQQQQQQPKKIFLKKTGSSFCWLKWPFREGVRAAPAAAERSATAASSAWTQFEISDAPVAHNLVSQLKWMGTSTETSSVFFVLIASPPRRWAVFYFLIHFFGYFIDIDHVRDGRRSVPADFWNSSPNGRCGASPSSCDRYRFQFGKRGRSKGVWVFYEVSGNRFQCGRCFFLRGPPKIIASIDLNDTFLIDVCVDW